MAEKHFFDILAEEAPTVRKVFTDYAETIKKDGGLDEKTYQLIYIAIKASVGEPRAVAAHAAYAKKAGATREEVRGAVIATLMTHGVTGISSCLGVALEAYDEA